MSDDESWERAIVREAWFEWRIAAAYMTGVMPEVEPRAGGLAPRWFVREELGFGAGEGPSLRETMAGQRRQHARAAAELGADAPWRLRWLRS